MTDSSSPSRHSLHLRTKTADCAITIAPGSLSSLGAIVRSALPHADKALLIIDSAVESAHGVTASNALASADFITASCTIEAREANKSLATVETVYAAMLDAGLERGSPVVAVGGGVVCDIAGFAAATFHRGVPIVMVPTTLLAMVDASIGGKNGVNINVGSAGALKNMIGTVWQPRAIAIDPETLATLPMRHIRCGLAESIKVAMLRDEAMLAMIGDAVARVEARDWNAIADLIARSAAIKVSIVEQDEREDDSASGGGGGRALLNLGHTFAHAFELIGELDLMHGEAVAIGLCAAASIARRTNRINDAQEKLWRDVIISTGLPTQLPRSVPMTKLLDLMRRDKKVRHGKHRLVLPTDAGGAELVDDIDECMIGVALIEIGATA